MVISTRSKSGSLPAKRATASAPPPAASPIAKPTRSKAATATSTTTTTPSRKKKKAPTSTSTSTPSKLLLPDLTLVCDDGSRRAVRSLLTPDTPGLILFTYPRANTGGCTTQATGLSAFADEAAALGYALAGASYDAAKSQASWKAKHNLKCTLLCDTLDAGLLKKLGAHKAPKGVKRSLFVVTRGGGSAAPGERDEPVVVVARTAVSPKEAIAIAQEYVRGHPCKGGEEKDEGMDEKKEEAADGEDQADADMNGKGEGKEKEEEENKEEKKEEENGKAAEGADASGKDDDKKDAN